MSSILGLSPSTISREIRRNSGFRGYRPKQAQRHIWIDKSVGGILWQHLRRSRKRYRKRNSGKDLRGQIVNRRSIDERPASVNNRKTCGHWEGDTIIGKSHKGALVTLVERKSRLTLIASVGSKQASVVSEAVVSLLRPYKRLVKSITFDNGKEFAYHKSIADELEADVYFAHPYS